MNASEFMDKQIMDLSQPNNISGNNKNNNNNSNDFADLMNPQSEESNGGSSLKKEEIFPSYDFQPIHRPVVGVSSLSSDAPAANASSPSSAARAWNSLDSKPNSSPLRSCNSQDHVDPDKIVLEKAQKVNDSAVLSEIDEIERIYADKLLQALDALSAKLSQLDSRTRHLEHSVDDLKVSVSNNQGSADVKMRQLENILLEMQSGMKTLKDKQEVMEGQMQLAKLHISKVEQSPELSNATHPDTMQQTAASAPPQQSGMQQMPIAAPQQVPSLSSNSPPPSFQQNIYAPPAGTPQFPPGHSHLGPQREGYLPPPSQTQEAPCQQYQIHPQALHQQQPSTPAPQPQQYQPAPTSPYPQPPQPPQQQHPSAVGSNAPTQFQPPLGHRQEESPYSLAQTYPPNLHQPAFQPGSGQPHSQPYYGNPPTMYEPPPSGRSSSGFPSAYVPSSGPSDSYPYSGQALHYGGSSSVKPQPHYPAGGTGNYPQLPTARILPQAIPTAAGVSGGSSSGGSGNRVPIDDVIDKVTNMGFPREHVRATVRRLTENGQSVDLNVVLDKLMNDGDVQPQKGWFVR